MISLNNFVKDYEFHQKEIDQQIKQVLTGGWYILGGKVRQFEKQLAKLSNIKYCVGVGNGFDALELSLRTLGIKKGDKVITTPVSAFATTLAIINLGAIPVFADIHDSNGLINAKEVEKLIDKKTKAVLPVNLYGQMTDIKSIAKICNHYKLKLIEDSAQAVLSHRDKIKTGQISDCACLSFYPTKNLGAYGDGGAVLSNNEIFIKKLRMFANYGQVKKYIHQVMGRNSRLDELQAGILLAKLNKLKKLIEKRRKIAKFYQQQISNKKVVLLKVALNSFHTYHLFVIKCKQRNRLARFLEKNGVQTLSHYPTPIYEQAVMKNYNMEIACNKNRVKKFCNQILSIPINPYLLKSEREKVIQLINQF